MNKFLKGCLIIVGVLIVIILIFCGIFYYQISTSRQRNEADDIECANTEYIIDDPIIEITATKNVGQIKLILIQDSKSIDSADVVNKSTDAISFNIPFKKVRLSDKIVVKTENNKYVIKNMNYFNDAKWGMFGYLGKDCEFSYNLEEIKIK